MYEKNPNKSLNVGIMGFGKTGKAVATVLLESKQTRLEWVARLSRKLEHRSVPEFLGIESDEPGLIYSTHEMTCAELLDAHPVDVIIDFSAESGVEYYGEEAARRGITIVTAISGYSAGKLDYLRELSASTRVICSPNITLGINFLILASKVLKQIAPFADIEIIEEHFKSKPEVSGTAKVIARNLEIDEGEIKTIRAGGIIGVHEVLFGFPYQTVRLKHESIMREAFGNGVLFVINHLPLAATGLFTMQDLLSPYFNLNPVMETAEVSPRKPWWKIW